MRLSVIIPCYNEVDTIDTIIDAVNAAPYPHKEIIVIDDSKDNINNQNLNIYGINNKNYKNF